MSVLPAQGYLAVAAIHCKNQHGTVMCKEVVEPMGSHRELALFVNVERYVQINMGFFL